MTAPPYCLIGILSVGKEQHRRRAHPRIGPSEKPADGTSIQNRHCHPTAGAENSAICHPTSLGVFGTTNKISFMSVLFLFFFFIQEAAVQNKCPLGWGAGSQGRRDSRMGVTCAALKHRRGKAPHAARAVRAGRLTWFIFHFPYCSSYKPVSLLPALPQRHTLQNPSVLPDRIRHHHT